MCTEAKNLRKMGLIDLTLNNLFTGILKTIFNDIFYAFFRRHTCIYLLLGDKIFVFFNCVFDFKTKTSNKTY